MAQKTDSEWKTQQENLLIAIDQLEQMAEVMGEVLSRVKKQVNALEDQKLAALKAAENHNNKKPKQTTTTKTKKINLVH
jgi:hypothetical protein